MKQQPFCFEQPQFIKIKKKAEVHLFRMHGWYQIFIGEKRSQEAKLKN